MKSLREILELLEQCLSGRKHDRRLRRKNAQHSSPEALEPRLLLAADLSNALYSALTLDEIAPTTSVDSYLVAFDAGQDVAALQAATGASAIEPSDFIDNAYTLHFDEGITVQAAADSVADLDGFEYLHPNNKVQKITRAVPNDPLFGDQWHLTNTGQGGGMAGIDANVESVWDNFTGAGVTIGIVDDGLETTHEDLAANVNTVIDYDFNDRDNDPSPNVAFDYHGTSVAGVAAGKGNNGVGITGVAWDAELVGLRLIGGPSSDLDEANALTHENQIIDIYNNSWGPADNGRISTIGPQALAALAQSTSSGRNGLGTIHTWAAGNGGDATNDNVNYDPYANSRHTIAVGALSDAGTRSSYSDVGAALVVVAPSNGGTSGISTTDLTGANGYDNSNYTNTFGGTSSATPLVSGVIALMLEANPNLTYRDVTDILIRTGERVDAGNADWVQNGAGLWVNHEYGFGNIDAAAAVAMAESYVSLGRETSSTITRAGLNVAIPDNGSVVSQTVNVSGSDVITSLEYVEVVFNATHSRIGDLRVVLTSPDGTESVLADTRPQDTATAYPNFVFSTNRNWDESNAGDWKLTVQDNTTGSTGTLNSFSLKFYGHDSGALNVTQSGGSTVVEEFGLTDSLHVSLITQPASDVVIDVSLDDATEATADETRLVFTPTNWQTPQAITITGVLDFVRDGDQDSTLTLEVNDALSDDAFGNYSNAQITVTTLDNDFNIPGKATLIAPEQLPPISTPRFEWTTTQNAVSYNLVVRNIRTGNVIQQASGLTTLNHTFVLPFFDGVYEATLTAVGATGIQGPPSDPLIFAIGNVALPGIPTIISPAGGDVLATSIPTFEWTTVAEAFSYELFVRTSDNALTQIVTPATGATTAQWQFTEPLAEGSATVWVRGLNALGQPGTWSAPSNFVVDAVSLPGKPTIIRPNVSVTNNAFPTFAWAAPGGDTYQLWVGRVPEDSANGTESSLNNRVVFLRDYESTDYTHFKSLENGHYVAWVRSFNAAGEASAWSDAVGFEVAVPLPARPEITQVIDNDTRPTIEWDTSGEDFPPNSTFHLWVNNLTTGESRVIQERELTTTSYTPDFDLSQGRYGAWVQVTSAIGAVSQWSRRFDFNINVEAAGTSTVMGPVPATGETSVVTDKPTFAWAAADGAASYQLWVNNVTLGITRVVHEKALTETSFTPEVSLPQGTYKVWVRALNAAGEVGDWSLPYSFDLNIPGPAVPTVTGPVANQVGTVATATPAITWQTLGGADTYNLELQTANDQQTVVTETGLTEESYTANFSLNQTTYRVRVQAVNTAGETSAFSDWFSFRIDVANPTTPVALTPNSTVTSNTVNFTWTQEGGNFRHEILVRDLLREETIVFQVSADADGNADDIAEYSNELRNGTYRFWVRGFNAQGVSSGWSNPRSFIVDGNDLANVEVDSDLLLASLQMKALDLPDDVVAVQSPSVAPIAVVERPEADSVSSEVVHSSSSATENGATSTTDAEAESESESEATLAAVLAELADPSSGLQHLDDLS